MIKEYQDQNQDILIAIKLNINKTIGQLKAYTYWLQSNYSSNDDFRVLGR